MLQHGWILETLCLVKKATQKYYILCTSIYMKYPGLGKSIEAGSIFLGS